jgi:hypothetical protein
MAFENYSALVASITSWLMNRQDLATQIPEFIALAEADLNTRLRDRRMHKRVEATTTCATVKLPKDWLEAVEVHVVGCRPLNVLSLDQLHSMRAQYAMHRPPHPVGFAFVDSAVEFVPAPSESRPEKIRMTYFSRLPPLGEENATNWALEQEPSLYLYGALLQAAPFLIDDERVDTWRKLYEPRIASLNAASKVALHSGGTLKRNKRSF